MAGSITWRAYTGDNGTSYSIRCDKSNASGTVTGGTGALLPVRTANAPVIPQGLRKRYANTYNRANPAEKRRFYIGTSVNYIAASAAGATITAEDFAGAGDTAGVSQTWVITSLRGEKAVIPPSFSATDTGETDGTTTQ